MKYWIIINNKQEGPFTLEELSRYPLTLQTPVWHQGLPQWVKVKDVAEVRYQVEHRPQQTTTPPYGTDPYVSREGAAAAPSAQRVAPAMSQPYRTPYQGHQPAGARPAASGDNVPERPSNYLGWAIAATLLCCLPMGVVAIFYASSVNNKYRRGDYAGARKASERAELWIILSVTLGLLWMPFSMIIQMLAQL
ncbi:MAG: CD225/dispanin family protein [Muribaculaceae bacterium]|nr:CD225/dispanin family protein [Muribaculaceae bacterium]